MSVGMGSGVPITAWNIVDASAADRVSRPRLSKLGERGNTPSRGQRPTVVFRPKVPQKAAGNLTEPPVSEPTANAQRPAATATAGPLLEPPGMRLIVASHGFQGVPRTVFVPTAPRAN